jgi:putative ABC transport system permease protein
MLRNYIKTAVRSILRHRSFSFINIFGLSVAMALSMCIIMLVADQMMYDRYNTKRNRIYRINSQAIGKNGELHSETSTTSLPLKQNLIDNYTGIEKAVRIRRGFGNMWLELEQNVNIPLAGYFADPEILDLFEYELEYGDAKTALIEPYAVVLTKAAAKKLFRQENPVGESFKVGVEGPYKVTGVLKETSKKSHIAFEALASMATVKSLAAAEKVNQGMDDGLKFRNVDNIYDYYSGWVYVLLEDGKTISDIEPALRKIEAAYAKGITSLDDQRKVKFIPQGLMDITPGSTINNAIGPVLPWIFVYFFAGLAAIVMLTSCFNFTNLSIARSLTRAREIGVRKVTGAMRWQIFIQFLSESVVIALLALVFAIAQVLILKPIMLQLSFARLLRWDLEVNYVILIIFLAFAVMVGLLAGVFPAAVLSGFQPVKVLKSLTNVKLFSGMRMRKTLLVAQFSFSLIFILSVIVVFNQLQLLMRADHGFNMEQKLVVGLNDEAPEVVKAELLKYPNIESVTAVSHLPAAGFTYGDGFKKSFDEKDWTSIPYYSVDEDYLRNINVPLIAGKHFSVEAGASNKNFILINERALETFHFKSAREAIGEEVFIKKDSSRKQIIGVVKNYNHQMIMEKMEPMVLIYDPSQFRILQVKYSGAREEAGKSVAAAWAKINPTLKIESRDFSEEIHKFYDIFFGDLVSLLSVIAVLAILISCLGLLGMATYTTETRLKEISIRKILGSSDGSLVYLLSKGYVTVLVIAIFIAVPSAYFVNNLWLEQLAYHVSVDAMTILIGVSALIIIGAITIGSQTWRAAYVNPVDNLKSE